MLWSGTTACNKLKINLKKLADYRKNWQNDVKSLEVINVMKFLGRGKCGLI